MLSTTNQRHEYKKKGEKRVAKFLPRWDGPYKITNAHPEVSTYTLQLNTNTYPCFMSLNLNDILATILPYFLRESCPNHRLFLPLAASKSTSSTKSLTHANTVMAINSSSVGSVTVTSTIFGLRPLSWMNAKPSTSGISPVVMVPTRGSFSRLVFGIIFPPQFLMCLMWCLLLLW